MKIRFLELAERELDDAVAWYDSQSYGLGMEFLGHKHLLKSCIFFNPF